MRSRALAIWLFPVPELPAMTRPCLRATKSSFAISRTCALSTPVWKPKSKSERSLRSGSRDSLILRSILRSIRAFASMASSRSRSSVGGSACCAAWASSWSRTFCIPRSFRVSKWCLIFVRVSSVMVVVLSEQLAVLIQGPLGDFGQDLLKLLPCSFVSYGLQGARQCLGPEDPLDGSCLKGLIPDRVLNRLVDILTLVVLLHPQDVSG